MKRLFLLSASFLILWACTPVDNPEKEEPDDPQPEVLDTVRIWASVSDGDKHLNPKEYKGKISSINFGIISENRTWTGGAWNNDHVVSRLDILTYDEEFSNATLVTGDLVSESGNKITKDNFTASYLATVETLTENYPDINYQAYDVITRNTVQTLEKEKVYAAWIDIYVPKNTPKGLYTGKLSLKSADRILADITYELEVFDLTLTEPEEWETFLDLWESPFASNRYYSGKTNVEYFGYYTPERQDTNPYSLYYVHLDPRYQAGLESELELYHKAGGNTITVHTVEGPDNLRFPCPAPSMIKWVRHTDGTFSWDYSDMDYWIELNIKHGIKRQIDLFYHTGLGWGFVYYDEATGKVTDQYSGQPGTDRWYEISSVFLPDLARHLEEKGWFEMAVLYMDERLYDVTEALVKVAESIHNSKGVQLKVGGAVNGNECAPLYDRMYDISIWEHADADFRALARDRNSKGLQTTIYSCGSGKMAVPNQPAEAAYAVYEAKNFGMSGILRWALNKFDEDPLHGTIHPVHYPGDCYLIYPDEKTSAQMQAQSSPRFEKLCEGMRNTEKLNLIKKNCPQYSADVDDAITALRTGGDMVKEAGLMRGRINELSKKGQN